MPLDRYGLQTNPFGGRFSEALDGAAHVGYYATVDGFAEQKPKIDIWGKRVPARTQLFFIHGPKGTGRTSVANYVAERFRGGGETLKVVKRMTDDDHLGAIHYWMDELELTAWQSRPPFSDTLRARFEAQIRNARAPYPHATPYKALLHDAIRELDAQKRRLVAVFEDVRNPKLLTRAQEVFDPDPPYGCSLLVIFTSGDEAVVSAYSNLNPPPSGLPPIGLRPLSGQDVLALITERWAQSQAFGTQPFHEDSVTRAFGLKKWPLRRAVRALEFILERKGEALGPGQNWPDDRSLAIDRGDIFESVTEFDVTHPL